jgi:hypothetical protein
MVGARCGRSLTGLVIGDRGIIGRGEATCSVDGEPGDLGLQGARVLGLEASMSLLHLLAEEEQCRSRPDSLDSDPVLRREAQALHPSLEASVSLWRHFC